MDEATQPRSPIVSFLTCMTLCYLVAFIGSQGAFQGLQGWYQSISKPAFTPPNWLFAPVWTVLYGLIGFALWQVWRSSPSKARTVGLWLFAVQLVLNGLWSWIFFAWQRLPLAFVEIVVLDVAILLTLLAFNKVRSSTAWLMLPYLAWCLFATLLTFGIWRMNANPNPNEIKIEYGEQP